MGAPLHRYFLVTFGTSWALAGVLWAAHAAGAPGWTSLPLALAYMCGPLLGAVAARRAEGRAAFDFTGAFRVNGWWAVAWLGPIGFTLATVVASLAFPGNALALDASSWLERLGGKLSAADLARARAQLQAVPPWVLPLVLAGQALLAGATVNALAALGEEYGWRGYLHEAWTRHGHWRAALGVGAAWGAWHAPLVLMGHNFPAHPVAGVALMTAWCTVLGPVFYFLRERTGSVVAVAVAHGTLNAFGKAAALYVRGGDDLTSGVTALPGLAVAAVLVLALGWTGALGRARERTPG